MRSLLLQNALLVTNDPKRSLYRGDLRLEGDRIAELGKKLKPHKGERAVDLSGQVLIPGFVQTHIHLCQTLFRNLADDLQLLDWLKNRIWPFEAAHNAKSVYASARLGIAELLLGGTTTILDMGTVRHTKKIFQAAEEMGIRAFIGKCLMDREENPKNLREKTTDALRENLELAEEWHGAAGGRLRYAHAPRFVLSCTEQLLEAVRDVAKERGHLIHTHASENRAELDVVRKLYGCDNVEYLDRVGITGENLVLAHCIWVSGKERGILAKTGTKVSHCPSSNLKLASGIAGVPALRTAGVCVSLGADGAPCNNNLNIFQEMRLASLIQKPEHGPEAMPAQEAFEMATLEGAKALGIADEVGSLEVGKRADLVALDFHAAESFVDLDTEPSRVYSALVYSASPKNVNHVWIDGQMLVRGGKLLAADLDEVLSAALKEQKALLKRV